MAHCISSASTGADPNVAVSNGDNSGLSGYGAFANSYFDGAPAPANGSQAIAIGDNSVAFIIFGNHDSVTAIDGGRVYIDGRTFIEANGHNVATAATGSNIIIVSSSNSTAIATSGGVISISGQVHGYASAENGGLAWLTGSGTNNSATASGESTALVFDANNSSAIATGDGTQAIAYGGNNNSATSTGVYTCAGNEDDNEVAVDEDLCNN